MLEQSLRARQTLRWYTFLVEDGSAAFARRFFHQPGLAGTGQGQFLSSCNPAADRILSRAIGSPRPGVRRPARLEVLSAYDSPRPPRNFPVALFFAVCAVVGTVLQRRVGAQSSPDESQLRDSLKSFTDVYALVEQNYAEPITGDKADDAIYDGAIPGMLHVLDPHSNFYDPKAYARMREDQRGHYYGVGMVIQQQDNKVYVVTPYEDTPSFRAGIHPGDTSPQSTARYTDGWTQTRWPKR